MQIFDSIKELKKDKNTVLTLGTFDGIHPGHIMILNKLINRSKEMGCRNLVIVFHPHPRKILSKENNIRLLTTPDEKQQILEKLGVENLLTINFTKEFSELNAGNFVYEYLINGIGCSEIVFGHDHHFGKNRTGNFELLKHIGIKEGFDVTRVDAFYVNDEIVSSTKIRNALNSGDIIKANAFLGRRYTFSGTVVEGDKRGRELGYPTANIMLNSQDKQLPAIGIYAVNIIIENDLYNGLLSIGKRPTFYNSGEVVTEVYIFDFTRQIYGSSITIEMVERLRGEEKFNSSIELVEQMHRDKEQGLKIFSKLNN